MADTDPLSGEASAPPAVPVGRLEWLLVLAVALLSMVAVAWMSRRQWFLSDSWDFLTTREIGSLDDLFRPHAGHWQTPTVVAHRVLYGIFGMDYWPWYDGPRLVGHAALSVIAWRAMRWRGADRHLAFAALVILLLSGVSDWHRIATIGNFVVWPAMIGAAVLLTVRSQPGGRDRWLLFGLLAAALISGGQGVAVLAGTTFAIVVARRLRAWWPSLAGATAVYLAWFTWYRNEDTARAELGLDVVVSLPRLMVEVLVHAIANSLGLASSAVSWLFPGPLTPFRVAAVLTVGLTAFVVRLARTGRLGMYEGVLLSVLAAYLGLVVITRVADGSAQASAVRYAYAVTFMLVPALLPHLRLGRREAAVAVAVAVVATVGWVNVDLLESNLDFWEGREQGSRNVVEMAAQLIQDGEPFVDSAAVDSPRAGPLTASGLVLLLDDGWIPSPPDDPAIESEARGNIRFNVRPAGRVRGDAPVVAVPVDDGGCVAVGPGEALEMGIGRLASFQIDAPEPTTVTLTWRDDRGEGARTARFTRSQPTWWVTVPEADLPAVVTVATGDDPVAVCGVRPIG